MIVRFSDPAEFVDELARDPHCIARNVVRVTQKAIAGKYGITAVTVVASAKVLSEALGAADGDGGAYDLVRLEVFAGELWGHGENDTAIRKRAEDLVAQIEARLTDAGCGFVIAAGEYHEAAA